MPPFLTGLAAKAIAAVVLLALGLLSGCQIESWKRDSDDLAAVQARNATLAAQAKRENYAAAALETKKETQRVVYRTIYKEADAWVASQPAAACLDDRGVQLVNAALGGRAADPAQPDSAVQQSNAPR